MEKRKRGRPRKQTPHQRCCKPVPLDLVVRNLRKGFPIALVDMLVLACMNQHDEAYPNQIAEAITTQFDISQAGVIRYAFSLTKAIHRFVQLENDGLIQYVRTAIHEKGTLRLWYSITQTGRELLDAMFEQYMDVIAIEEILLGDCEKNA